MKRIIIALLSVFLLVAGFYFLVVVKYHILDKKSLVKEISRKPLYEKLVAEAYSKSDTIQILPFGKVDYMVINEVKKTIINFYHRPVKVLPTEKLNAKLKRNSSYRYSADSILKAFDNKTHTIVVTAVDITKWDDKKKMDWGIFGLGLRPGKICVLSYCSCRLGNKVTKEKMLMRVRKVTIHEIGHNFGLYHCKNDKRCVMYSAEGKGANVDRTYEDFCSQCKMKVKKYFN